MPAPGDETPQNSGLLARIASGDPGAMEKCVTSFSGLVWSIVRRRLADQTEAEDLVQEIFTDIWRNAGRYIAGASTEEGFIAMIARRRAIDWQRRQARMPIMASLEDHEELSLAMPSRDPALSLDRETVLRALEKLPAETRELFTLYFEQGLTHSEISEMTGLPLGSVKTRLRRGLLEAKAIVARFGETAEPTTGTGT